MDLVGEDHIVIKTNLQAVIVEANIMVSTNLLDLMVEDHRVVRTNLQAEMVEDHLMVTAILQDLMLEDHMVTIKLQVGMMEDH